MYPQRVSAVKKDLYVGVRQSLIKQTYETVSQVDHQRTMLVADRLEQGRDNKGMDRFDVRKNCEGGVTDESSRT